MMEDFVHLRKKCASYYYFTYFVLTLFLGRFIDKLLIYWTINDSRSKYQLMCWRHPTFMDTRPWYRATNLLKYIYTLLRSYHTFLLSILHSALLLCFTLLASNERQPLVCSLLHHLQPRWRINLQHTIPASLLHLDLRQLHWICSFIGFYILLYCSLVLSAPSPPT
jgi:hypothetical protein